MDIVNATQQFLEDIHNPAKKGEDIYSFEGKLATEEECTIEEVGKVFQWLLVAVQKETSQRAKNLIFSALNTAISYRDYHGIDIEKYIDWEIVKQQLPLLSEGGLYEALDMFYARLDLEDIPLLKTYLEHSSLIIRMDALNLLCETIAYVSGRDRDVEVKLRSTKYHHLQLLVNNPERRKEEVSEAMLAEQFSEVRNEVMEYIQMWLEKKSGSLSG